MAVHAFDPEDAIKYGVEPAILLKNIRYWLEKNKANYANIHDGYIWTYNSAAAFEKMFPYMSKPSITRYLKKLCNEKALIAGNYNKRFGDRTSWYTTEDFRLEAAPVAKTHFEPNKTHFEPNKTHFEPNKTHFEPNKTHFEPEKNQNESALPDVDTNITSDVAANNVAAAVDNFLSDYEKACWEWAKKEKFWSSLVYSREAFLKHYNSESEALKGQYANYLALKKTTEPKKNKPPMEQWAKEGFKSKEEYNKAHLQKLKAMEGKAKNINV